MLADNTTIQYTQGCTLYCCVISYDYFSNIYFSNTVQNAAFISHSFTYNFNQEQRVAMWQNDVSVIYDTILFSRSTMFTQ